MIHVLRRVFERRSDVAFFEIGKIGQDVRRRGTTGQHVEHILHADPESANAGPATAHARGHRDSIERAHVVSTGRVQCNIFEVGFGLRCKAEDFHV